MSTDRSLASVITGSVRRNVALAPFTTFRIGGNATYFVEPETATDMIVAREFASSEHLPFFIIGNGSNVLISDDGIAGVVVNLQSGSTQLSVDANIVTVGAGVRMATFVDFAIRHGLGGVEMLAGIPATIGGAVWMNAGCYGGETSDRLLDVTIIRGASTLSLSKAECGFRYRHSGFEPNDIIVEARFELPHGNTEELRQIKLGHLKHRNEVQPVNLPNCGSVFKNPKPHFSAQLIQEAGLRGTRIGGAEISTRHANFITNIGGATAADVIALMNLERRSVFERTGIILEPEVQLIGFSSMPLKEFA